MKKKYIIIAVSLLIIAMLIVGGNVFAVKNISVVFNNHTEFTNESEILQAAQISDGVIIFNLKEKEIKNRVSKYYKNNNIVVTNVERKFPNKIVIYSKERIPIYKLSVLSTNENATFVTTDKDFQMGDISTETTENMLISVENVLIKDTFDINECIQLRILANTFLELNIAEEALPYFIETITFDNTYMQIKLRNSSAVFSVLREDVNGNTKRIYADFLNLSEQDRLDCKLI